MKRLINNIRMIIFFFKIVWRVWDDSEDLFFRIPIKTAWEVSKIFYKYKKVIKMKVKIDYEYEPQLYYNYFAKTEIDGKIFIGVGNSFQEAKENLLEKVYKYMENGSKIPEPETIELIRKEE